MLTTLSYGAVHKAHSPLPNSLFSLTTEFLQFHVSQRWVDESSPAGRYRKAQISASAYELGNGPCEVDLIPVHPQMSFQCSDVDRVNQHLHRQDSADPA